MLAGFFAGFEKLSGVIEASADQEAIRERIPRPPVIHLHPINHRMEITSVVTARYGAARHRMEGRVKKSGVKRPPYAAKTVNMKMTIETILSIVLTIGFTTSKNIAISILASSICRRVLFVLLQRERHNLRF